MEDIQVKDVMSLDKAVTIEKGDTLLIVRQNDDGTQTCLRTEGADFNGKSAYDVAREEGYTGTYDEWAEQIRKMSNTDVGFDAQSGEIVITTV